MRSVGNSELWHFYRPNLATVFITPLSRGKEQGMESGIQGQDFKVGVWIAQLHRWVRLQPGWPKESPIERDRAASRRKQSPFPRPTPPAPQRNLDQLW